MVKLIVWSKTGCAQLCRLPEQESPPCMVRIGRRGHPHRSTRTSASVDADIRIGRRRHPRRSAQTSASVGADVLIGGYGIPAIPTQPPPRHPHAATPRHPHATILLADCVGIARMLYPPIDSVWVLLLCLTFEHKLVSDIQIAVEIQSGVSVVEVGAGLTAIEEVERTGWRYVQTFG